MILLNMIPSILMMVAPILITAVGGMVCERSGVVNIALEGLMQIGACTAAAVHVFLEGYTGVSPWIALLCGAVLGMVFSSIHAFASISLKADQTVSGTGINLLANGVTLFFCQIMFQSDRTAPFQTGLLPTAGGIYPTVFIAAAIVLLAWFLLYKTVFGLRLRACGENPMAVASSGVNVIGIRYWAVLASGFLAGLAGGCLVLTETIQYTATTINGTGFIALAAVSFGRWKPLGVSLASLLFGSAVAFAIYVVNIQSLRALVPTEVFSMMPYIITVIALIVFSGKNYAPLADGKPYERTAS